jgi:glycosyltransferase involved in cell wall biosynthesis
MIDNPPLVSVIIHSYNHEKYIQETILSIINQTYNNIELLITDDGSSDSSYNKICEIKEHCNGRFIRFEAKKQEKKDVIETLNSLINMSSGNYIFIMPLGDIAVPQAIEAELDFLSNNPDYALCVGLNDIIDENGRQCYWDENRNNVYAVIEAKYLSFTDWLMKMSPDIDFFSGDFGSYPVFFRTGNHIPNGYLIRKSIFKETGLYVKEAPQEDFYMNMQIAKHSKMKLLDQTLYHYRWYSEKIDNNNTIMNKYFKKTLLYEILDSPVIENELSMLNNEIYELENELRFLKEKNVELKNILFIAAKKVFYELKNYTNILQPSYYYKFMQKDKYQKDIDFSIYNPKVNTIAFYLPQFHSIPENDKWWGKDFTEWTNTQKAKPGFKGHYQPREPHDDIGYYNLADIETIKKQVILAKKHGIYGFCFYLYWFSGKRLLEKPLDMFLEHPEIDFKFCLCWANENWTRRWDGLDNEILIKQNYSNDDPYRFILDIKKYITDKRYIKIDGIPIILVYNPKDIPNIKQVFAKWRKTANKNGIGGIKILICNTNNNDAKTLSIEDAVDGMVEFPPHNFTSYLKGDIIRFNKKNNVIKAIICNYKKLFKKIKKASINKNKYLITYNVPLYRTSMLCWDNTPRTKKGGFVYTEFSFKIFYEWVSLLAEETMQNRNQFIFINAWNEWGEGTYLEPDKKYGYACLNTLSKAICGLPL